MLDQDIKTEAIEKELGVVRDILRTITKTVKTFNVYPKDNPIYQKFATELFEKFEDFFESNNVLRLDIEQYTLLYKENEVYRSEEKTDNIAMLLFSDGLRQITFNKGITFDEISDFIDILRFAPKADISDDDDIVTLLWEKNINNISYNAVEETVDDDLVVEEALLRNGLAEEISKGPSADVGALLASTAKVFPIETRLEELTESELAALTKELADIDEKWLLSSAVGLFFGLLRDEHETEAFPELIRNIGRIMDIRLQGKDLRGAIQILNGLRGVLTLYNTSSQRKLLEHVISRAGNIENLKVLFEVSQDPLEIRQYLFLLGPQSLTQMIQVLRELNGRKQRRLLCEILAEIGKQNIDVLAEALKDEKWFLVRNIVMILGMTNEPGSVKHLGTVLKHRDVRVRRETIRALEGLAAGDTNDLFIAALEDSDVTIRIAALRALRRLKAPGLFEILNRNIARDELRKKPFAEKKELLEAIAVFGGEAAFPLLSELFRKKGLIEKEENTEIRAAAAYGLGLLKSEEATLMLEKETSSKKSLLREACLKALGKLNKMETTSDRVAGHGKSVITNLYILLRITGIYDSMNDTIMNIANRLLADMEILLQETGEFTIKIIKGTFFIEGSRIKAGVSDIESFTSLADELKNKAIGLLDFRSPVSAEDLISLAYAIRNGSEVSEIESALEQKLSRSITLGGPVILQEEEEIDVKDSEAVAKRAYDRAVSAMRELDKAIKSGRRTKLKKIKRALQFIVDSILKDESDLLGLFLCRTFERYYYCHPVNVAILSVAMGNRLGFDRVDLRTLAMAAFFHDFGKVTIPMSILNKKTAFTAKEEELIKRHPIEGIKVLLKAFGLNETSILSMLVSFEHHMKLDLSGYPAPSETRRPNIFSRIVSIADDYDSLISGRVYQRTRLRANDARDLMLRGSGTIYDPALIKAFAGLFQ